MNSKHKVIIGSLIGALAIHAAFVACGGAEKAGGGNDGQTFDGGISDGSILDALIDRIASMIDASTKDAKADTDSGTPGMDGGGGSCGCTVQVQGPMQAVPASESSQQLAHGKVATLTNSGSIVTTGPFVLTDLVIGPMAQAWPVVLVAQPAGSTCTPGLFDQDPGFVASIPSPQIGIHGSRYVIPAGQMVCAYIPNTTSEPENLAWAGFKPYQ